MDNYHSSITARYMVRNADYGIISASSARYHQAFGTLVSFADGPVGGSTGTPYFYIAEMSTTWAVGIHILIQKCF